MSSSDLVLMDKTDGQIYAAYPVFKDAGSILYRLEDGKPRGRLYGPADSSPVMAPDRMAYCRNFSKYGLIVIGEL
jgi:hypothetical protein